MPTSGTGATRLPLVDLAHLSAEQERVAADISSGPRGGVRGPFLALLHSPETAARVQRLGEHLRYGGVLPQRLKELAILVAARHWSCAYEWAAHRPLAEREGIAPAVADAIAAGRRPEGLGEAESDTYEFCAALHRTRTVPDAALAAVARRFGEAGVIELTALCGYYAMLAMVLNVAGVEPPAGSPTMRPPPQAGEGGPA